MSKKNESSKQTHDEKIAKSFEPITKKIQRGCQIY